MNDSTSTSKLANSTYHHGDLPSTLITAALNLAKEKKDWNFSLREVARRAGVSHNAPYNHFSHKKDLMTAAALVGHELLRQEIASALTATKDPCDAIFKAGFAYVRFGLQNPALYQLMFTASQSGVDWRPEVVLAEGDKTRALVEEVICRGAAEGAFARSLTVKANAQAACLFAWSTAHGFTMIALSGLSNADHISMDQLTGRLMNMVLDALGAAEPLSAGGVLSNSPEFEAG